MLKKRKGRYDYIVMGDGGINCKRCGEQLRYDLQEPMPMWQFDSLTTGFAKQHHHCEPDPERVAARMRYSTVEEWMESWDTGASARTIMLTMCGRHGLKQPFSAGVPHDPTDFGRCSRLLAAPFAKGWRERLPEVAKRYPELPWARLVDAWDELEALHAEEFPTGKAPKLYERLQTLAGPWKEPI